MRWLPLLVLLSACSPDVEPGAGGAAQATEADRLFAAVDRDAAAGAFERAQRLGYTARVVVEEEDADGTPVGREALVVRGGPRGAEVVDRQRDGAFAGAETDAAPRLRSPLETALSEDPPYLDPAVRDQYRRTVVGDTVVGGRRLAVVEAALADPDAEQSVRRVRAAVDPESGQPVVVEVERAVDSIVYGEASRVRVALAPGPDGVWVPRTIETDALVDVPLAPPRRIRTTWTVQEIGGAPIAG